MGGSDLYLIPRYMAKIGYLMLRGGLWENQQILPLSWVLESSANHENFIPNNPASEGYGYQWWTYPRDGAYCARGWLGQYIWIVPSHDLVIVITGNNNAIDDHWIVQSNIIPATTPVPPINPLVIILPVGASSSVAIVLGVFYWKRRRQ